MEALTGMILLSVFVVLCLVGLFGRHFEDNLLHALGLGLLLMWALSEWRLVLLTGHVTAREVWLYGGLLAFGSGTAVRTWLYTRKRGPRP